MADDNNKSEKNKNKNNNNSSVDVIESFDFGNYVPISGDEYEKQINEFKEQFNKKDGQFDELTKQNEQMMNDLKLLDDEIKQLEERTKLLLKNKSSMETELVELSEKFVTARQKSNIHCSNKELRFSQSKDDLEFNGNYFDIKVNPYFMRDGFEIIFYDIYNFKMAQTNDESNNKTNINNDNNECTNGIINIKIDNYGFSIQNCYPTIYLDDLMKDLNETFDWKSFLIICRKKFRESITK